MHLRKREVLRKQPGFLLYQWRREENDRVKGAWDMGSSRGTGCRNCVGEWRGLGFQEQNNLL